jgi:lipoprotein-anchoring transpeptidase ErfK/SrfK
MTLASKEFTLKPVVFAVVAALLLSGCDTASPPQVAGPVAPPAPAQWGWGYSQKAKAEMAATFGTVALKPAESRWVSDVPAEGPTKIVVSLTDQLAWVYRGDRMIAATTISSGKKDHESPVGQFPILAKEVFHKSNRYSAAPMPFMLRLNRWGVALHGGVVPGYPASHGCIRLPMAFAKKLFGYVARGDNVYVEG